MGPRAVACRLTWRPCPYAALSVIFPAFSEEVLVHARQRKILTKPLPSIRLFRQGNRHRSRACYFGRTFPQCCGPFVRPIYREAWQSKAKNLHHINRIDAFPTFVDEGFTDFMLPSRQRSCLPCLDETRRHSFRSRIMPHCVFNSSQPFFVSLEYLGSDGFGYV